MDNEMEKDYFVNLFNFAGKLSPEHERNFFTRIEESPAFLTNKVVLDAGCGYGRATAILCKHSKKVVAIDHSSFICRIAKNNLKKNKNVEIKVADLKNLPFRDNTFDFVHCSGVLHHIKDEKKVFRELTRVLKRNGTLFIAVVGDYGMLHKTMQLIRPLTTKVPQKFLVSFFKIITPPSLVLRDIAKVIRIKIPRPYERQRIINITVDYLNTPYYKFYKEQQLLGLFTKQFANIQYTDSEVFTKSKLNKYLLGNGWLQIKGIKK